MKVEVKKLDQLKRELQVEVSGDEYQTYKKNTYLESGKKLKVPGFRPGNVPYEMLVKHHDKALSQEFMKQALPLYYQKALQEQNISPAGYPQIHDVDMNDRAFSFRAEVEIQPEISVSENEYRGIKIKEKVEPVEPVEIEKVISNIKEGIKKVAKKELSDEEIAHWVGYPDRDTLREAIKGEIFIEKLRSRRQKIDSRISQHLLKQVNVQAPRTEVENMHKEFVRREMQNLQARGVPQQDIEKYKKEIEEKTKTLAEDQVKLSYIIRAIAQKEHIEGKGLGEAVLGTILYYAKY
ncbi:MAG: hypothetical protein GF333_05935 [Candidatus Omnitrophica bacterium]|nr:hypothetical protein [Candidatus Omnitrophota bacterium]